MSIVYRMDGALLPFQSVRLQGNDGVANGFPSMAYFGQAGVASVRIEDTTGVLDIDGWHTFTVEETACSKPRIFSGWLLGRTVSRGPYRHSASRIWDCDIIDQNELFMFQVFRSTTDSVRPAETDIARVTAVLASGPMTATPIHDNGRFSTANPRGLGASNFVGQTPSEPMGSSAGQSGKNYYAYWDDATRQISLHYDAVNTGPASTLSISNVAADNTSDAGGTCYAPLYDAQWVSDPTNVYTGVLEHWAGGYLYSENATLIDDLSPSEFSPVSFKRDFVYQTDRIGKATTAATYLQTELLRHSTEDVVITCSIQVVARDVCLLRAGDIVSVKFSHLPGFTTFTNVAVKSVLVEPVDGQDAIYNLHLELANFGLTRGAGGGSPGVFPVPSCTPQLVQESDRQDTSGNIVSTGLTLTTTPTTGNLLLCWVIVFASPGDDLTPTGFTPVGSWQGDPSGTKSILCRFFYKFVAAGDTTSVAFTKTGSTGRAYVHASEWTGLDTFVSQSIWTHVESVNDATRVYAGAEVTPPTNTPLLLVSGFAPSLNVNDSWHPFAQLNGIALGESGVGDISSGGNSPKSFLMSSAGPGRASTLSLHQSMVSLDSSGITRGYSTLTVLFTGTCTNNPAVPGAPVGSEQPPSVGSGQTGFTTGIPYAAGSLRVYVDGLRQPATETDPATGAYTLLFDPRPSEYVVVDYQARTGAG